MVSRLLFYILADTNRSPSLSFFLFLGSLSNIHTVRADCAKMSPWLTSVGIRVKRRQLSIELWGERSRACVGGFPRNYAVTTQKNENEKLTSRRRNELP